jgi:hypothetical protein
MAQNNITIKVETKEIERMFNQLPRQVNKDTIWGRYWRKVTKSLLKESESQAPIAKKDIPYPPAYKKRARGKKYTGPMIKKGTLKKSMQFFRTRASKGDIHGAYVGPRVKGKFAKNKGGYYGAWIGDFGGDVMHFGKFRSKANKFMSRAWKAKGMSVSQNGIKEAEKIFDSAVKSHTKRMKKYGGLGY